MYIVVPDVAEHFQIKWGPMWVWSDTAPPPDLNGSNVFYKTNWVKILTFPIDPHCPHMSPLSPYVPPGLSACAVKAVKPFIFNILQMLILPIHFCWVGRYLLQGRKVCCASSLLRLFETFWLHKINVVHLYIFYCLLIKPFFWNSCRNFWRIQQTPASPGKFWLTIEKYQREIELGVLMK